MKPTDFSKHLSNFLGVYLPTLRNVSKNTVASYSETFRLLLGYCRDVGGMKIENISLKDVDHELIVNFLAWITSERGSCTATRNQRLAAIHSFFRYVQSEAPELLLHCQRVISIPFKTAPKPCVDYMSVEDMKNILAGPDLQSTKGRRDLTLLSLLYDTAARVQEICDLTVRAVRLDPPAQILLTGKGKKSRAVPILSNTVDLLRTYLSEHGLLAADKLDHPLFFNQHNDKLTRAGVAYILAKYTGNIPNGKRITPHVLRHTKAMHLLQADTNIIYIRDFLGHSTVETTKIYAQSDIEMKRQALEKITDSPFTPIPAWARDGSLMDWLKNLSK